MAVLGLKNYNTAVWILKEGASGVKCAMGLFGESDKLQSNVEHQKVEAPNIFPDALAATSAIAPAFAAPPMTARGLR